MKICQKCHNSFDSSDWLCPACGFFPRKANGFVIFDPEGSNSDAGFNPDLFEELFELEAGNFWFRVRNRIIAWSLEKYFPAKKEFLEIGCGTGFVLANLEKEIAGMKFYGSELHAAGLAYAERRLERSVLWQMDARKIPFKEHFDVIGAFDVLEHIKDDQKVLEQIFQALRPGGGVVLTVPQHPVLWSMADEHAHHERRYKSRELQNKVKNAGFEILRTTSFVSFLLPLMMVSRFMQRASREDHDPLGELKINRLLNAVLERILEFESLLIRKGVSFPFGGSLLLVAQKPESS